MFGPRLFPPDSPTDDEDLQFLTEEDRARELGLEVPYVNSVPDGPLLTHKIAPPPPPPVPGRVGWRLHEVARSRGIVNQHGPYQGHVALMGLARGAGLAHTTVKRILQRPESMEMVSTDTLARLCGFLRCQPGDLLVYNKGRRPDDDQRGPYGDHLKR